MRKKRSRIHFHLLLKQASSRELGSNSRHLRFRPVSRRAGGDGVRAQLKLLFFISSYHTKFQLGILPTLFMHVERARIGAAHEVKLGQQTARNEDNNNHTTLLHSAAPTRIVVGSDSEKEKEAHRWGIGFSCSQCSQK
eukprot:scaffold808_cov129-Skeletonema_dohrnii-CCMP3373.AAC.2